MICEMQRLDFARTDKPYGKKWWLMTRFMRETDKLSIPVTREIASWDTKDLSLHSETRTTPSRVKTPHTYGPQTSESWEERELRFEFEDSLPHRAVQTFVRRGLLRQRLPWLLLQDSTYRGMLHALWGTMLLAAHTIMQNSELQHFFLDDEV